MEKLLHTGPESIFHSSMAVNSNEYVHDPLNQEITAIGGHYILVSEVLLPFGGKDVLYLIGHAAFDTTCCGAGGCGYALVQGYVKSWKKKKNGASLPVSEVEPIRDPSVQKQIQRLIEKKEMVQQVIFM